MFLGTFLHGLDTGPGSARAWEGWALGRVGFWGGHNVKWRCPASTVRYGEGHLCRMTADAMGVGAEISEGGHVETKRG